MFSTKSHPSQDLYDIISFQGFDWSRYWEGEENILTPQLEALGYTDIRFVTGECDSFGPLSRKCIAYDKDGVFQTFFYG